MQRKKIIILVTIFSILSVILASTYAYWQYRGDNKNFSLVVNGLDESQINYSGNAAIIGDFLPSDIFCESASTTISFSKDISAKNIEVVADVYMDINSIGTNMSNSSDVYWIVTSGDNSIGCVDELSSASVVSYGNFNGKIAGDKITLLENISVSVTTKTYTVWIWIDSAGTDLSSLSGETIDVSVWTDITAIGAAANAPALDPGMIPVTIANDGTVTTVSEDDSNWYDYGNKEWANVVLVNEEATTGVDGSQSRSYYLENLSNNVEVNESDILAYYVWIPRYKYRIPYKKCSDIPVGDRNMEDYPECYAPYTMSDSDKGLLVSYYNCKDWNDMDEYYSNSLSLVNYALQNGMFFVGFTYGTSIVSWINAYNAGESNDCGEPARTLTLTPSEFNGNNTLHGEGNEVSIDIQFESENAGVSYGNGKSTYYTHPTFIWDGETIPGIWVGKFETSPDPDSDCSKTSNDTNCNNTTQLPRILPNVSSLRYQYIGNQFKTSLKFAGGTLNLDGAVSFAGNSFYGLTDNTDSHMMKNSEWGAVAYLSRSKYGINSEVYINNSSSYITGRSGGNVGGSVNTLKSQFSDSTTSSNQYNSYGYYTWIGESISYSGEVGDITDSTLGTKASTTGNVTGIYDMSGSAWEYLMGNYNNTVNSTYFPILPDSKYYDLYLASKFTEDGHEYNYAVNGILCTLDTCGGHALLETYNWYNDYAYFVDLVYPWFVRGGVYDSGTRAGVFSSLSGNGSLGNNGSWRSVLILN